MCIMDILQATHTELHEKNIFEFGGVSLTMSCRLLPLQFGNHIILAPDLNAFWLT